MNFLIGHSQIILSSESDCFSNEKNSSPSDEEKRVFMNSIGLQDIYVINLDTRSDRLSSIKAQLDYLNLPFIRYPAVDGKKMQASVKESLNHTFNLHPETKLRFDWIDRSIIKISHKHGVTYGTIGCWQSHLQVYFEIRDKFQNSQKNGPVLILEDDIIMEKQLPKLVKEYLKSLPENWDMLFIGFEGGNCIEIIDQHICRANNMVLASSYIINGVNTANKLIYLSNTMFIQLADIYWMKYFSNEIHAYILRGGPLTAQDRNSFGSDIPSSSWIGMPTMKDPLNNLNSLSN